jgi:alpha-beta hydrolase superfamily lysophospholipase
MLAAIDNTQSRAAALAVPTLMVVAGDDRLVDARGSDAFFARLAPGTGTMHRYPDFYHEVLNEVDAYRVFDDMRDWLSGIEDFSITRPATTATITSFPL